MAQDNEKELQQLKNRFHDLADRSFSQGVFTFTGFLGLSEQDIFWKEEPNLKYAGYSLYGGCDGADRVVVRFGNSDELGYEVPFPIVCLHIKPLMQKFADELSHRDFLGALMNLGIDRSTLGDIQVREKRAYLFCHEKVQAYIGQNLDQIRHTSVSCSVQSELPQAMKPVLAKETLVVSSLRTDAVVAKLYHLTRSRSIALFREKKIYVNGRSLENNAGMLKEGDVVSVRGFGKFVYVSALGETRKGRLSVLVERYV